MSALPIKPFFRNACIFETALIPVAYVLAAIAGINPNASITVNQSAISWGVLGALPLYLLFYQSFHVSKNPQVRQIQELMLKVLGQPMMHCRWYHLLVLASIAGIAEEFLFRGVIQPWIENGTSVLGGLILSSLLFGLLHFITPLYAVMTVFGSLYLGYMMDATGERNLMIPMIIHGLYDFLAFLAIARMARNVFKPRQPRP